MFDCMTANKFQNRISLVFKCPATIVKDFVTLLPAKATSVCVGLFTIGDDCLPRFLGYTRVFYTV